VAWLFHFRRRIPGSANRLVRLLDRSPRVLLSRILLLILPVSLIRLVVGRPIGLLMHSMVRRRRGLSVLRGGRIGRGIDGNRQGRLWSAHWLPRLLFNLPFFAFFLVLRNIEYPVCKSASFPKTASTVLEEILALHGFIVTLRGTC